MTDTSSLAITHATTDPYPVPPPPGSPLANGAISDSVAPDEEPYTIKCICQFDEDDGNTVFCEGCETWQHIICYYPKHRVPDVHNCVDCEPRPLDVRRAIERQRAESVKERSEDGDRKKRPSAKATKKKSKEGDVNGFGHQRSESGARDQPPPKKTKTSHRSSASISALAGTPILPSETRKRRSSTSIAPSPTKPPGPSIPLYSNEFLHLYDRDDEHVDMDSNLFVNVNLVGDTASWVKDPEALKRVTKGSTEDTFNWSDAALDRSRWPNLTTDVITDPSPEMSGPQPTWKILKTQDPVQKDQIVGEITGKVGLFKDYCLDPKNRWQELRHPEPFVFFSSHLPLYIDSRHEGSVLRYTRRSCNPNVTMKIFITNDVEYHFCFVAKEDIPPTQRSPLCDSELPESSNGVVKQESGDSTTEAAAITTEAAAICISNTLANFGGCACGMPRNCLLAKLDSRRHPKFLESGVKQANGKRRRVKAKSTASPRDTSRTSISRAGSETTKLPEDDEVAAESRSTSGSARGQPRSRDTSPVLPELSTREKRKIADAEKHFQQLEQQEHRPGQKKKKRVSGPSAQSPAAVASSTQTGYFPSQPRSAKSLHLDSAGQSRSPTSALSPGPLLPGRRGSPRKTSRSSTPYSRSTHNRPAYVDAAVQANLSEPEDSISRGLSPRPRSVFVPMTLRLLKRFSMDRLRSEEVARQQLSSAGSDSVGPAASSSPYTVRSPVVSHSDFAMADADNERKPSTPVGQMDVEMQDDSSNVESESLQANQDPSKPLIPPPWPSTAAHNTPLLRSVIPADRGNLRVTMPPPSTIPTASSSAVSPRSMSFNSPTNFDTSPNATVPPAISAAPAPAPTPAKKKLSLGDYLNRRNTMTATPTSEKSQVQAAIFAPQNSPSTPGSGPTHSADGEKTPIKASPVTKAEETLSSPDVAMKDAPESTQPHIPSISS
ncbi:uncharacterized protein N7443_005033 [Penicillium atrosanguineum]|uniref:uncharacterized protein n=1 Tax=Penicillium atrosanguineum TaxID=1132637 RepID=UPI00238984E6|nr:uncharacterized protein N7443_005033 [Penicillium atrosanguineum]KAJ5305373.1 hypothetical protein N7443_005033 [Penicillium atrosanguineum]